MTGPVLLAVEDDTETLRGIEQELRDRYARHYRVACLRSPTEARTWLAELATAGEEVALILAGQQLSGMTGSELLDQARHLHPHAKRTLVIEWSAFGNPETGGAIFDAIAHGRIDHYLLRPSTAPDELFHHTISSLLLEWAEARRAFPFTVQVVGESWAGRAYELREVLGRCAIPHSFSLADSADGRALVASVGKSARLPLVVLPSGKVLQDPSNAEIAIASGTSVMPERKDFDLVIVGAGPTGLSAAVYGASEGFSTLVVDDGGIGGQATSSSRIRNYLGFPRGISGRRLAQRAYEQAWVFGANFAFMQQAADLRRTDDWLSVRLSDFGHVRGRAVLLATGASYRRLGLPALEALNGMASSTAAQAQKPPPWRGDTSTSSAAPNSAGQAALYLARYARRVTLVVRAESLDAGMSHYLVREIESTPNIGVRVHSGIVNGGGDGWLDHLVLHDQVTGAEETVEAGGLFVMIGARPRTEWLPPEIDRDPEGFVLSGTDLVGDHPWRLDRPPLLLETSMPGVLAAGDVRHGAGKRVAASVGEGAVAIRLLHQLFASDRRQPRGRPEGGWLCSGAEAPRLGRSKAAACRRVRGVVSPPEAARPGT